LTLDIEAEPVKSALSTKKYEEGREITAAEHKFSIEPTEIIKPIFFGEGIHSVRSRSDRKPTEATIYMVAGHPIQLIITNVDGKEIEPDYISIVNKETSAPVTSSKGNAFT
jgi:hypothetical protein